MKAQSELKIDRRFDPPGGVGPNPRAHNILHGVSMALVAAEEPNGIVKDRAMLLAGSPRLVAKGPRNHCAGRCPANTGRQLELREQ